LRDAILTGADLRDAILTGADLRDAILTGANLTGARLPIFSVVPEIGEFTAFKKLDGGGIAQLRIPETARRTSSLVGRKCRASHAWVDGIWDTGGHPVPKGVTRRPGVSDTVYTVGQQVFPDGYDDDIRIECTNGIHFFITRKEAEEY
jgi:hypothetical protein